MFTITPQALSHCVAFSTRDLVARWPKDEIAKLVLLVDCSSPVPSFEKVERETLSRKKTELLRQTTTPSLTPLHPLFLPPFFVYFIYKLLLLLGRRGVH
jgi:hypothetical protein